MQILILGGSGFIGTALGKKLLAQGHSLTVTTRNKRENTGSIQYFQWNGRDIASLVDCLENKDIVINLIGENIAGGRWTESRKQAIVSSRVEAGEALAKALSQNSSVHTLIQGSASGYYGYWDNMEAPQCTEKAPFGQGFLASTCIKWEQSIADLKGSDIRTCIIRTAPVFGHGGMLAKLLPVFKMGVGGVVGSGKQPLSWIHIDDLTSAIEFLIENRELSGIFNLASPENCSMKDFTHAFGKALNRPTFLPVPGFALHILFGSMAEETILNGQKAYPQALLDAGFTFKYVKPQEALNNLFKS